MIALKIFLLPDLIIFVKLLLGLAQDISLPGWWEVDSFTICVCVCVCVFVREGDSAECVFMERAGTK